MTASGVSQGIAGNFGLPGIIDLPSAKRLPDGELIITHQSHEYLFMNGISFQVLPKIGLTFRYGGHGRGGNFAQERINWDRSFDAHISLFNEKKYLPAISIGLRDFIGTGWYSSEYVTATKSIGNLELTTGLGFGRLAGRNSFSNPLGSLSSKFENRLSPRKSGDRGGTLGNINWFQGDTSLFYGMQYRLGKKCAFFRVFSRFNDKENSYLSVKNPWNFGVAYQANKYLNFSAQYLHGSRISLTAEVNVNPVRPPLPGGSNWLLFRENAQ